VEVVWMLRKSPIEHIKEDIKQQFLNSTDFEVQIHTFRDQKMELLYLSSLCDEKKVKRDLISPFFQENIAITYEKYIESLPNKTSVKEANEAVKFLLRGYVGVFLSKSFVFLDLKKAVIEKPTEATVENTIQGPQLALSEDLSTSLIQIRNRYRSTKLKIEKRVLGKLLQTMIFILYDEELADPETIKIMKNRLDKMLQGNWKNS
jgi:spore germination protein